MSLLSKDLLPLRDPQSESDLFSFSGSVGPNGENRREDVIRAQTLLARSGDFEGFDVPTGWPSSDLYRGIRKFQKRNGLDTDGTLLPMPAGGVDRYGVGETLEALRGVLGERVAGQPVPTPSQVDAHYENEARSGSAMGKELLAQAPQPKSAQRAQGVPAGSDPNRLSGPESGSSRPVPEHKKSVFDLPTNRDAWDGHQAALHKLLPDQPVLRHILGSLYAEEGGRVADPASGAVGGILPETLDDMRRRGKLPDLPEHLKPGDLTPEQQAYLQKAYFDDVLHTVGGAKVLENLPQGVADMLGDALYLDGRGDGTRFLQQAINDVSDERAVGEDGRMGPQTWEALRRLAGNQQSGDAWLDEAATRRIRGKKRSQGEIDRISRLRPSGRSNQ